jgi:predicted GNAT family N-acyltransferase
MSTTVERSLGPPAAAELRALYGTYEWWDDRDERKVRRALAATDEVVALRDDESGDLVSAARVLTDYTYYAMVFDVIVHEDHRGEGLGEDLMAAVVTHPPLADLHLTLLAREGLVPFYESCGFEPQGRIDHPDGDPERLRFLAYRPDD